MDIKEEIKQKVYQMFILGLEGIDLQANQNLVNALKCGLGGVIFFSQNIKSVEQIKSLTTQIKDIAQITPFLSIDQEGGRVERTENLFGGKKYLSAKYAAEKGVEYLRSQIEQISADLKEYGMNLNFAPVLDVNTNPNNPIIGERAFSSNTDEVIKFGKIVVDCYLKNGIMPCAKHFPGHGDANVDSHISLPKIDMKLEEMEKNHIRPFKEVSAPMIMVAHLHCSAFDDEVIPSSLSNNVIGYLRNKLGYKGLVITDDMIMGGVLGLDGTRACAEAIRAGVDILLYRDSYDETIQIIENLVDLARVDEDFLQKIEQSYSRILKAKTEFIFNIE